MSIQVQVVRITEQRMMEMERTGCVKEEDGYQQIFWMQRKWE